MPCWFFLWLYQPPPPGVSVTVLILHIKHGTEVPQATGLEGKGATQCHVFSSLGLGNSPSLCLYGMLQLTESLWSSWILLNSTLCFFKSHRRQNNLSPEVQRCPGSPRLPSLPPTRGQRRRLRRSGRLRGPRRPRL